MSKNLQKLKEKYEGKYFETIIKKRPNITYIYFVKNINGIDEYFKQLVGIATRYEIEDSEDGFYTIEKCNYESHDTLEFMNHPHKLVGQITTEITKEAFEAKLNEALEKIKNYQNQ